MLDVLLLEPEVNMLDVLLPDVAVVAADNLFGGFFDIIFSTGKILIIALRYFMSEVWSEICKCHTRYEILRVNRDIVAFPEKVTIKLTSCGG